jgi:hypothetical protein
LREDKEGGRRRVRREMEVVPGQEFDLPLDVGDAEVSAVAFHPEKPIAYVAAGEHLFGSPLSSSPLLSSPPPHKNTNAAAGGRDGKERKRRFNYTFNYLIDF